MARNTKLSRDMTETEMDALDGIVRILSRAGGRKRRYNMWNPFEDDYYDSDSSTTDSYLDFVLSRDEDRLDRQPKAPDADIQPEKPRIVHSLMDLAAKVTAQHYSCESIENHDPPLDEALLKKVAFWAFPQDEKKVKIFARLSLKSEDEWRRGESFYREKRIQDIRQVGFMVSAIITKQVSKVSVTFEKQHITSTICAMCPQVVWCQHIIAVIVHRIRHSESIPVHAPVTETLSTLTRDQLQKLLQYAINEDPAGILGRVFQHIDALRDTTSDMNSLPGAPDPTFGVSIDDKSTWCLSLEQLKKNLRDDLRLGYRNYPDSCNIMEKVKSGFFDQYFQRVTDLTEKGETEAAGEVLMAINEIALDTISQYRSPSNMLKRILHDSERLTSCFIVFSSGEIKSNLLATVTELNKKASELSVKQCEFVKTSLWADLSSMKLPCEDDPDCVTTAVVKRSPFYQPMCAGLIMDAPLSLSDLFAGNQSTTTSGYDEPLSVMLMRLDCLLCLEPNISEEKSQKLGIMILKKLLELTLQLSILRSKYVHFEEAVPEELQDGPSENGPTRAKRSRQSKRGKAKKKSDVPRKAAAAASKAAPEPKNELIDGLAKGQICYCLLYVCYTVSKTMDKYPLESDDTLTLMDAILRAVELGRFKSAAPRFEITSKDYSWLVYLENKIEDAFVRLAARVSMVGEVNVADMYSSALFEKGLKVYGECVPIALISLLLRTGKKTKSMIKLCTDTICNSLHPLKHLTIPEQNYVYTSEYLNNDSVVKKWTSVLTEVLTFCSSNITPKNNQILTRILKHFEMVDDCEYLVAAYGILKCYQSGFVEKEHKILLVKVVLQGVKHSANGTWTNFYTSSQTTWDTLTKLGKQLDMEFPRLILPVWLELCKYYNSSQLKGIIEVMKDSIKKRAMLPAEMSSMLLKYFESKFKHDEECCDLMDFFSISDKGYQQALKKIAANAENYTPRALLLIAKRQHEETTGLRLTLDKVFHKDVFNLIKLAFIRIQALNKDYPTRFSYLDTGTFNYLKWFFERISERDSAEAASGKQFQEFMTHLSDSIKDYAEVLVTFLRTLEKCEYMLVKAKEKLGTKLIESFQKQFDYELRHSNHTSYHRVLGEMAKARHTCIQFVDNGAMLFRTVVADHMQLKHKGKKKFIKLMGEYFKELCQD